MSTSEDVGFEDLEFVRAEPPMVQASTIGSFDGRCSVVYYGAAGRCTGEAEYMTTIQWKGDSEYVSLCPRHANVGDFE